MRTDPIPRTMQAVVYRGVNEEDIELPETFLDSRNLMRGFSGLHVYFRHGDLLLQCGEEGLAPLFAQGRFGPRLGSAVGLGWRRLPACGVAAVRLVCSSVVANTSLLCSKAIDR